MLIKETDLLYWLCPLEYTNDPIDGLKRLNSVYPEIEDLIFSFGQRVYRLTAHTKKIERRIYNGKSNGNL
jgi:hypothetical protein